MQLLVKTCLMAATLALLLCAGVAASDRIAAAGDVRTGEFRLTSTLAGIVGAGSARNAGEIIPPDAAITWDIYVPGNYQVEKPAGLMVYISPTSSGEIPRGWKSVMDERNMIWIAARDSGNRVPVSRRVVFAIIAPTLAGKHYTIDPERIYLSGLSGGGKVASMVATDHAKLFKGAIYNCGVDFWDKHPPGQFELIKQNHYVFVTGTLDQAREPTKKVYRQYRKAGVENSELMVIQGMTHRNPGRYDFDEALQYLDSRKDAENSAGAPRPFLAEYASIDLVIENGQILDGLGNEAAAADVVVAEGRIVFVGNAQFTADDLDGRVKRRIDANGRIVAPGFIDLHSHGDPFETPGFENFLAMGVTTITLGQDGSSPEVADLSDWMAQVAADGSGTNIAMFVGHGTLRTLSGIGRTQVPEPRDLERMLAMLETSLQYTFGMSTGLEYNPGLNATSVELLALAEVVGRNKRIIMSHLRNEDDDQLENSIAELLDQGRFARVHVSHLKSVFGKGADRADQILNILDKARESGIEITADMYPYSASYTGIDIVFPVWAKTPEQFAVAKVERHEELRDYLRDRVNRRNGPEATLLGTDPYTGKTLAALAHELEMPFEDVLIDVIGPDGVSGAYFVMNDELQSRIFADPHVGVCSDGRPTGFHPRGHGTFAKIIEQYVMRDHRVTLAEAVRKMTSFAAGVLGITDRGVVRAGMAADLIIFEPSRVHENSTYPEPLQLASGFDVVIVNGRIARENGRSAGELFGSVLKPAD